MRRGKDRSYPSPAAGPSRPVGGSECMPLSTRGGGLTGGTADMSPGCSASISDKLDGSLDGSSETCEVAHDTPSAAARANITVARGRVRVKRALDRDPASMAAAK